MQFACREAEGWERSRKERCETAGRTTTLRSSCMLKLRVLLSYYRSNFSCLCPRTPHFAPPSSSRLRSELCSLSHLPTSPHPFFSPDAELKLALSTQ